MDRQQEGDRKRAREGEEESSAAATGRRRQQQAPADAVMEVAFDKMAAVAAEAPAPAAPGEAAGAAWQRPEGVFDFPWQKCRGGLGMASGGGGWELRDVFFRSLVDGRAAAIGVPGDRLSPPPSKRTLFDDVDAWLAAAGDGEVDPLWRSLEAGPRARRVTTYVNVPIESPARCPGAPPGGRSGVRRVSSGALAKG